MNWSYRYPSTRTTHIKTGAVFDIKNIGHNGTIDDLAFIQISGTEKRFSDEEISMFKKDFLDFYSEEKNRYEMTSLLNSEFMQDPLMVAQAIEAETKKSISTRTVQSWLIEPGKKSSRKCPEWALKALNDYLKQPKNTRFLSEIKLHREKNLDFKTPWSMQVYDKYSVKFATSEIDEEEKKLKEWEQANFPTLAKKLFMLELKTERHLKHLQDHVLAIIHAIEKATDLADLKAIMKNEIKEKELVDFFIKDTRKAIETKSEEFSENKDLI